MQHEQLEQLFSTKPTEKEVEDAILKLRIAARPLAETINKHLTETASKQQILGQLFRVLKDSELALMMDGVSNTKPMIVRN